MAAVPDVEMESVNLNTEREGKEDLEEETVREDGKSKDLPRSRKVHRIVSKWMLPEPVRRTYLERASCLPPPLFIILISLAELAVFIYYAVWKPQKQWITLDEGILKSPFTYRPEKREEAWRFISYMLVHAGVQHIVGNLFMQLVLGIPLEMVHKGLRVGLVYLAGVLAGSLASSIFDPLKSLVGASGGVYALMGGYFMNVIVNFREMIPAFGIFRLLAIILIVASDIGFALYRRFFIPESGSPVLPTFMISNRKAVACYALTCIFIRSLMTWKHGHPDHRGGLFSTETITHAALHRPPSLNLLAIFGP